MESDQEEEEPLALDYARSCGLCTDYTTELNQLHISDSYIPSGDTIDQDLWGPSELSITNAATQLTRDRLAVGKDAALLLRSVLAVRDVSVCDFYVENGRECIRDLKQELPILRTDVELDVQSFGNADIPNLRDLTIPSESVDEEEDEGFGWPTKYLAYPRRCDEQARTERLAVSKGVLVYLQDTIRDTYTLEDAEKIKAEGLRYKPNIAIRPLTPPLLPLSPPISPYVPSSPVNHLELASESSDGVVAETRALEHKIMAADSLCRKSSDNSDDMLLDITHPPQFSPLFEDRRPPGMKRRGEDLRIEGPLTPPMFSDSPSKKLKSVSFTNALQEGSPFELWTDHHDDGDMAPKDELPDLAETLELVVKEVKRRFENEQLSEVDTKARVAIPDINFTLPTAPWDEYRQKRDRNFRSGLTELDAQMNFLLEIKREDLKSVISWHGVSALNRELPWNFFLNKPCKVRLDEKLHGETELNRTLADPSTGAIASSSTEVWKKDGLRILDDRDDDEEELELTEVEEGMDLETLVRKRKLEIQEETADPQRKRSNTNVEAHGLQAPIPPSREALESHHHTPSNTHSDILGSRHQTSQVSLDRRKAAKTPKVASDALMFGGFSATAALHMFMATQGEVVQIVSREAGEQPYTKDRPDQSGETLRRDPKEVLSNRFALANQHGAVSLCGSNHLHTNSRVEERGQTNRRPTPPSPNLPPIPDHLSPCSFIVSIKLLQRRSLTKRIECLYPAAEVLYRDYNLPHSTAQEADIILSPSTGLVFTTLQLVKQRALPGQPDRSPIKELVAALQLRYERLVVVISEGLSREMEELGSGRPEDPRDKEALFAFEGFAAKLEGDVLVDYIRGGEQALARSIVVAMAKYGLPHGSRDIADIKPLATETNWEVFLRRAGLNPFAAQVILASLQQPFDLEIPHTSSSPALYAQVKTVPVSGLPAFVMMSVEERVRCFQALMGGSRILRWVGGVLDQEWVSAAHGFRM